MQHLSNVPVFPTSGPPAWWQLEHPSAGYRPVMHADAEVRTDVCVVGAGVSGTSTAYHLAARGLTVRLIDAREVAGGASGRNGGFLLAGLNLRYGALADRFGRARAAELYGMTVEGRDRLFSTAQLVDVPDAARRIGSLRLAVDASEIADLDTEHALLTADGFPAERLAAADLPDGLAAHFLGGLRFPDDGASVPAQWVRGLAAAAAASGVLVHEHSPVTAISSDARGATVTVDVGDDISVALAADHVVVCTEAHLGGVLPELAGAIRPYRSQVLAADGAPADRRVLSHPTWSRRGWDYAQQTQSGVVVAGGELVEDQSRYAMWDEAVDDGDQAMIEGWITRVLGFTPTVLARWAGTLSISWDDLPVIGPVPGRERVFVSGGWGGAGNVLGFVGGELVSGLITGSDTIPAELHARRLVDAPGFHA